MSLLKNLENKGANTNRVFVKLQIPHKRRRRHGLCKPGHHRRLWRLRKMYFPLLRFRRRGVRGLTTTPGPGPRWRHFILHRQTLARPRARTERQDACRAGQEPPHGTTCQISRAHAMRGRRLGRRGRRPRVDEGRTEVPRRCILGAVTRVHERRGGVRG
jgi:hypothetical protein